MQPLQKPTISTTFPFDIEHVVGVAIDGSRVAWPWDNIWTLTLEQRLTLTLGQCLTLTLGQHLTLILEQHLTLTLGQHPWLFRKD